MGIKSVQNKQHHNHSFCGCLSGLVTHVPDCSFAAACIHMKYAYLFTISYHSYSKIACEKFHSCTTWKDAPTTSEVLNVCMFMEFAKFQNYFMKLLQILDFQWCSRFSKFVPVAFVVYKKISKNRFSSCTGRDFIFWFFFRSQRYVCKGFFHFYLSLKD